MPMEMQFNPQQLELKISQIGERAMRGMSARMRTHAILIRDLARAYAPVDTGLLEDSIDYKVIKENRRNGYIVHLDLDAARRRGRGVLGDYAFIMEEELHPFGRKRGDRYFTLGELSKQKAKSSGKKVGGRFLARAIRDGTKTIMQDMVSEVRRVTNGGSSWAGTSFRRER